MHKIIKLDTNTGPKVNVTLPFAADALTIQNLTGRSILIREGGLDYPSDILGADNFCGPIANMTFVENNLREFSFSFNDPSLSPIPTGTPTTAVIRLSQGEALPTFSGQAITNVQATIPGTVNASVTGNVGVSGSVGVTGGNVGVSGDVTVGSGVIVNNTNIPVVGFRSASASVSAIPGASSPVTVAIPPTAFAVQFQVLSADPFYVRATAVGVTTGDTYFAVGNMILPVYTVPILNTFDASMTVTVTNYATSGSATIVVYFLYEPVDTNTVYTFPYLHTAGILGGNKLSTAGNSTSILGTDVTSHQTPYIYGFSLSVSNRGTTLQNTIGLVTFYLLDGASKVYTLFQGISASGLPLNVTRDFSTPYLPASWVQGNMGVRCDINTQLGLATFDIAGIVHATF